MRYRALLQLPQALLQLPPKGGEMQYQENT